jgi:hypothetical protein
MADETFLRIDLTEPCLNLHKLKLDTFNITVLWFHFFLLVARHYAIYAGLT